MRFIPAKFAGHCQNLGKPLAAPGVRQSIEGVFVHIRGKGTTQSPRAQGVKVKALQQMF